MRAHPTTLRGAGGALVTALALLPSAARAGTAELEAMFDAAEDMLKEFVAEVETAYAKRCDLTALSCANQNYDECYAAFPAPSCPSDFLKVLQL